MKKRLVIIISICFIVICITTIFNNMTLSRSSEPQSDSFIVVSPQITQCIVVKYIGPSVAPEYFRKYHYKISAQSIEYCVKDYENTLHREAIPYSTEEYAVLLKGITALNLYSHKEEGYPLCGGSTFILELYNEDGLYFSGYNYGDSSGTLSGNIDGLTYLLNKAFPKKSSSPID